MRMETLETNPVRLRQFTPEDQESLAELCNNRNIWNNLRDFIPSPYTRADAALFIGQCMNELPPKTFAIQYGDQLVGTVGLVPQPDVYRISAELGYWIGEPYWGKGIATEAVKLMIRYGFDQLGLKRIYAGVFDFNKASCRVLEKAGFSLESIRKQAAVKNGRICDEYQYCKLARDSFQTD